MSLPKPMRIAIGSSSSRIARPNVTGRFEGPSSGSRNNPELKWMERRVPSVA